MAYENSMCLNWILGDTISQASVINSKYTYMNGKYGTSWGNALHNAMYGLYTYSLKYWFFGSASVFFEAVALNLPLNACQVSYASEACHPVPSNQRPDIEEQFCHLALRPEPTLRQ